MRGKVFSSEKKLKTRAPARVCPSQPIPDYCDTHKHNSMYKYISST